MSIKGKQMLQIAFFMQLLSINASIAQIVEKSGSIIKSSNCNGTGSIDLLAGREVVFKNGFQFKASPQSTLTAKIDESLYKNPNYQVQATDPTSSDYPDNRVLDKSLIIGSIPGEINVGATGAAEYSMPIELPVGPSGLKPNLSINYNSAGGNSILGNSFILSGISKISLTPQSAYFDGINKSATQEGPFSLDGQRLLSVQNGESFKTEAENYLTITKTGVDVESYYFTALDTRSNQTYEYGRINNSKESKTFGTYSWNIDKIKDKFNNEINFFYKEKLDQRDEDEWGTFVDEYGSYINEPAKTVDENVLEKITYGNNEIDFYYSLRDDDYHVKVGDVQTGISTLLDKIVIKSQEQIISTYEFKYSKNSMGMSCLVEVIKGNGSSDKLNSTLFRWNNPNPIQFTQKTLPFSITFDENTDFKGDFNNDGFTDLLIKNKTLDNYELYQFDKDGVLTKNTYPKPVGELISAGDFNGDGKIELLGYYNGKCRLWNLNTTAFNFNLYKEASVPSEKPFVATSDLDENGITDFYIQHNTEYDKYTYLYEFDKGVSPILKQFWLGYINKPIQKALTGDFNNDGLTDFILNGYIKGMATSYMQFSITDSPRSYFEIGTNNVVSPVTDYGVFDINNDGIDELLSHELKYYDEMFPIEDLNGDGDTYDKDITCYTTFNLNQYEAAMYPWLKNRTISPTFVNDYTIASTLQSAQAINLDEYGTSPIPRGQTTKINIPGYGEVSQVDYTKSQQTDINGDGQPEYILWDPSYYVKSIILITTPAKSNLPATYRFITEPVGTLTGDFNGDGATDFVNGNILYYCPNPKTPSLAAIIDGNNNKIEITYDRIVDKDRVQPEYPFEQVVGPFNVVSSIKKTVGSDEFTTSYSYSDSRFHIGGKGFLGFENTVQTTEFTEVTTKQEFNTSYFFPSKTTTTVKNKYNGSPYTLSITESTIGVVSENTTAYNRYAVSDNTTIQTDFDGNKTKQIQTYNTDFGHLKSESTSKYRGSDDPITEVVTTYSLHENNTYKQPESITITYNRKTIYNPISTSSTYSYWPNGLLHVTTKNGLTKTFTYDDWGNMRTAITSGSDLVEPQTDTYIYDDLHLNAKTYMNSCGQSVTKEFDIWGNVTEETDLRSKKTYHTYDGWGNLLSTQTPDGFTYTYQKTWADGDAPTDAYYYTALFKNGVLEKKDYFDRKGQNIRNVSIGYNGIQLYADKTYDTRGILTSSCEPYPSTGVADIITTYAYDDDRGFGRMSSETNPRLTKTFSYNINTATTTITKDNVTEEFFKEYDASGFMIKARDNGGEIVYVPDIDNQLARIESPGSGQHKRLTEIIYDTNRRKKELKDADAGTTSYTYYANGNVKTQTNANVKVTSYTYDVLNRTKKEIRDGIEYTYNYDADPNSTGLLSSITSNSAKADAESYIYDPNGLGRVIEKTRSNSDKTLTHKYEYDTKGRIKKLTYPGNFAILYEYNSYDDLLNIKNAANNSIIWKLDEVNALGQKTKETYGNGKQTIYEYDILYHRLSKIMVPQVLDFDYEFNDKQQLNYRTEKYWNGSTMVGFKENFTFDNLNRLETASKDGVEKMRMVYNINGSNSQIWSKTGVGSDFQYDYGGPNFINSKLSQFTAENSYAPHAHEITYTNRLKVETITDHIPNSTTLTRKLEIEYGIDNERFKQTYTDESGNVTKTWYTSQYEEIVSPSTTNRQLSYIFAGDELVAINVAGNDGTPIGLHYVYTDYLGSLRCITNASGTVEQKLSFDAWGNRRNPETGELLTTVPTDLFTARGFTGHEHLDAFGLINMNGRAYDPATSMFLSPDPYIQAPDFTQNFNRYTYCLNNPLMYTDPSGEFWHLIIGAAVGGVANWWFNGGHEFTWKGLGYFGVGAVAGALAAGLGAGISSALPIAGTTSGGFAAGFWGTSAATTATSSFISGFAIGAGGGAAGGFGNGFGNGLIQGHSLGQSLLSGTKTGLISGVSGGFLGGLWGGIDAAIDGRTFWDGSTYLDEPIVNQDIPIIGQRGDYNCEAATAEGIDKSWGGNMTQENIRALPNLGGDPTKDGLSDLEVMKQYTIKSGHKFSGEEGNPLSYAKIIGKMLDGNRVAVTLNTGEIGHSVVMQSVFQRTITKVSGKVVLKYLFYAMNPGHGGSITDISVWSISNAYHIFYIHP